MKRLASGRYGTEVMEGFEEAGFPLPLCKAARARVRCFDFHVDVKHEVTLTVKSGKKMVERTFAVDNCGNVYRKNIIEPSGFWNYISEDSGWIIHTSFVLHGTTTGRTASRGPNLQNTPKRGESAKLFRKVFRPSIEGWKFLELDYSQIELRIAAWEAGETNMLEIYRQGGDIHAATAAGVLGVPALKFTAGLTDETGRLLIDEANSWPSSGELLRSLSPGARRTFTVKEFCELKRFHSKPVNWNRVCPVLHSQSTMAGPYRNNHYVPQWYQRRFIAATSTQQELCYLDLNSGYFKDGRGVTHKRRALHRWGTKKCFYEEDLYTRTFGTQECTKIERLFFGEIDNKGPHGLDYLCKFGQSGDWEDALDHLLAFLSVQKLRTPKGLAWLQRELGTSERNTLLDAMIYLRRRFCALWAEGVWQIADASLSPTKFIFSDHPVTIYNRSCGPLTRMCIGCNDPSYDWCGSHTVYPLSSEKVLILTHLSWVRNPYQLATVPRPNPNPFRTAITYVLAFQTARHLSEEEVRQINFIIKMRAFRFIASGEEEWLYPEKHVSVGDWANYGRGFLLMPDPRSVPFTTGVFFGNGDGSRAFGADEYGRRPWDPDYTVLRDSSGESPEWKTFQKFQGEFARLFGPYKRGLTHEFGNTEDRFSDDYHRIVCSY